MLLQDNRDMAQVEFHRTKITKPDAEERFQTVGMVFDEFVGKPYLNRMFFDVFLVTPFDHFLAHRER